MAIQVNVNGVACELDDAGVLHLPAGQKLEIAAPGMRVTIDATNVEDDSEGEVTIGVLGQNDTYLDAYSSYSSDKLPPRYNEPDFASRTSALIVAQVSVPDDDWDDDEEEEEDEDEDDDYYEGDDEDEDEDEDEEDADAEAEYRDAEEEGDENEGE